MITDADIDLDLPPIAYDLVGPNPHRALTDQAYNYFLSLVAAGTAHEILLREGQRPLPTIETFALVRLGSRLCRAITLDHKGTAEMGIVRYADLPYFAAVEWLRIMGVPVLLTRTIRDYVPGPIRPLTEMAEHE